MDSSHQTGCRLRVVVGRTWLAQSQSDHWRSGIAFIRFGQRLVLFSLRTQGSVSPTNDMLNTQLERVEGIEPSYSAWKAAKTFNKFKGPFHSRHRHGGCSPFLNETGASHRTTPADIYQTHSFSAAGRPE